MKPGIKALQRIRVAAALFACLFCVAYTPISEAADRGEMSGLQTLISLKDSTQAAKKPIQGKIPDWMARWELAQVLSFTKRYQ